jgi:uncharacterized protein (TIGR02246 family)
MKRMQGLIVAIAVSASLAGGELASNAQTGTEEEAINAVIRAITEAFNRHDAKAWTRLATSDAQLVTVRGASLSGSAEIERGLTALFQGRNRNASVKMLDVKIRFIRPDVAIAHVTNELEGVVNAGGQTLPAQRELSLRVFVKNQGVWRITAFHNTTLQ